MLQTKLTQKLEQKLSPQQIQMIKMLELANIELEERIKQEIEVNPALEEGEEPCGDDTNFEKLQEEQDYNTDENIDFSMDDYRTEDDIPDYKLYSQNGTEEKQDYIIGEGASSLQDYLIDQLRLQEISERGYALAEYVIGNIDQDGYLRRGVEPMVDDYSFQSGIMVADKEMEDAVQLIQSFEPAGVASFTLKECLIQQLKRKNQTEAISDAMLILQKCFDDFSQKRYKQVELRTQLSQDRIRLAINEIVKLNPKPGNGWDSGFTNNSTQVIPDFILENEDGKLFLSLNNESIPSLHINKDFSSMMDEYTNEKNHTKEKRDALLFVKQKIDSARWFIEAVKQRHETMIKTMTAILKFQQEFFLTGDDTKLKPLILRDIAEEAGYDISTISRVCNSKYIQTEFGIYPLKYFFSESMQTIDGEDVSTSEIKATMTQIINAEDKSNPYNDDKLTDLLIEKGYNIARRTVAKYREQLGYPTARLRKEI